MKLLASFGFIVLLQSSVFAAGWITVEATVVEAKSRRAVPHDMKKVNQTSGVDVLTLPHAATRSGQSVQLAATRDFRAVSVSPTKHPLIPTGVLLRVTPHASPRGVAYTANITLRELDSVTQPGVAPMSTFTSREIYASGTPKLGEEVWLDFPNRNGNASAVRLVFHRKDR